MPYQSIDKLDALTENRYEAVLVASKHARHLNAKRLVKLARLQQDEETIEVDIEARKMTAVALREVLEGKVKYERADTE